MYCPMLEIAITTNTVILTSSFKEFNRNVKFVLDQHDCIIRWGKIDGEEWEKKTCKYWSLLKHETHNISPPLCTHHCLLPPLKTVRCSKFTVSYTFASYILAAIICLTERIMSLFTRHSCCNPTCNQSNSSCSNAQANDTIYNGGIEIMSVLFRAQNKSLPIGLNMIRGRKCMGKDQ
jgi:hypothetical protein